MAFTYLILNLVFLVLAIVLLWRWLRKPTSAWKITLLGLLTLTLFFDNLMILAGLFSYDTTKLLGWYIGLAPIEDFFYAIMAAIIIPALWDAFSHSNNSKSEKV